MNVEAFIPCFIDQFFPETGKNMIKLLEKLGQNVNYNPNQTCCGQIAFNSGFWNEAKELGEKFINDFQGKKYIVSPSASCSGMVIRQYPKLFHNAAFHNESKQLQNSIFEITDFIVNVLRKTDIGAEFNHKVTYHESCASKREYGLTNQPRLLLSKVKGLELIEMEEADSCCGFGGTFSVKFEGVSSAMAQQKVENALATGAEYIVSTDSSCLMNINGYIEKNELPIKCIHIVDLLAANLP
ncbi:MAG: (Fe-S)-binding protein [Bacteroidales bacterium]|jgi:L-lactate dehydrogenase complex protein LldE|nr:(Fe-S)-binding protein [Bacteroidales bacterium]